MIKKSLNVNKQQQYDLIKWIVLKDIIAKCKLALLTTWQASKSSRLGVEARNVTLLGKLAEWEDDRLISQNNHLLWAWMPGSFIDQRWEEVKKESENAVNLINTF